MIPSIRAPGRAGILFPRIAALPRCSKIPILLQIWETASPSSCPVWRANAAPSFFTSLPASGCHPPNVSATIGRKAIPCLLHSSVSLRLCTVSDMQNFRFHDLDIHGEMYPWKIEEEMEKCIYGKLNWPCKKSVYILLLPINR